MIHGTSLKDGLVTRVHLARGAEFARFVLAVDGIFEGGNLVRLTPDFSGGINGLGEVASRYQLSNWLAGISSGALYAFRALGLGKRKVFLSDLSGTLDAPSMPALANASAFGIARLMGTTLTLDLEGWAVVAVLTREIETSEAGRSRVLERGTKLGIDGPEHVSVICTRLVGQEKAVSDVGPNPFHPRNRRRPLGPRRSGSCESSPSTRAWI